MRSLALALVLGFLLFSPPVLADSPVTVDDVEAGVAARVAELDAAPDLDKAGKKERKGLSKAGTALGLYTGLHDKADLKKVLVKAVKAIEGCESADPHAEAWLEVLWDVLQDVGDTEDGNADDAWSALRTEKYRAKIAKLLDKAGAVRTKALDLELTSCAKASKVLVKAILKYRKAIAKAAKYLAKEGPAPEPVVLDRSALALVLDPAGDPVPNAVVGGGPLTAEDGVAVGPATVSAGGWVEVDAPGCATAYVEDGPVLNGSKLYLARVTPLQGLLHLTSGGSGDLTAGAEGARLECALDAADFASAPVAVGLASIDPLDVGPAVLNLAGHEDLHLARAFSLVAHTPAGEPVALASGSSITVLVEDGEAFADVAWLARFDPATGAWVAVPGATSRADSDYVNCVVSTLAPLYGVFAPEPAAGKALTVDQAELAFKTARLALAREVRASALPTTDPDVAAALAVVAAAARDLAGVSPDEKGKFALMLAATDARSLGDDTLADDLEDEALALATTIANVCLALNDCGAVERIYAAAAQLDMLGGSSTVVDQLLTKVGTLRAECGRWVGTVNFVLNLDVVHPGLDNLTLNSMGGAWREDHFIVLTVDPESGRVTVEDRVQHLLFFVVYSDESSKCPRYIEFYGQPAVAILELEYSGSWSQKKGFVIGPAALAGGSAPSITQHQHFEAKNGEQCQTVYDVTLPFPNHISLMTHGLWDATPVVSLQEILNSGGADTGSISGGCGVTNSMPEGGKYPFTTGTVSWRLTRVR